MSVLHSALDGWTQHWVWDWESKTFSPVISSAHTEVASSAQACIRGWHWGSTEPHLPMARRLQATRKAHPLLSTFPDHVVCPCLLQMFNDGCQGFPPTAGTIGHMTAWQPQCVQSGPWRTPALFPWKVARACKVLMGMGPCSVWPCSQSSWLWILLMGRH